MPIDKQNALQEMVRDHLSSATVSIFQDNSVMASLLPMVKSEGSLVYQYTQIEELMGATIRDLGENVTGGTIEPIKKVEYLKVLATEVLIDRLYVSGGLGNVINVKAENMMNATIGLANTFNKMIYYGDGSDKQLRGLDKRLAEDGVGKKFDAQADTLFDILDEAVDYVNYSQHGTKAILMNAKTRRVLTKALKANGIYVETSLDVAGRKCATYYDMPIVIDEAIKDNEIFIVNLSQVDGLHGVTLQGITGYEEESRGSFVAIGTDFAVSLAVRHPKAFAKVVIA